MKNIFDKTKPGNLQLRNRLIRSATWEALADERGHFSEEIYGIYDRFAAGGVGCIISGFTSVADDDCYFGGMARLSNDGLIPEHKRLTNKVIQLLNFPRIYDILSFNELFLMRIYLDNCRYNLMIVHHSLSQVRRRRQSFSF